MSEILNDYADPCLIVSKDNLLLFKLTAVVLHFDTPNRNKRIYPLSLAENFLKLKSVANDRGLVGMLGNPETPIIQFSIASHVITDLRVEDKKLIADIETYHTPSGQILRQMLADGTVAFRTMGVGNGQVNEEGYLIINDSYKFITINALNAGEAS
jgi:hypothetical protein